MIVQFFRYGDGLSKGPLNYLLGKDRQREHASILSGNEQEVAELIDSSPFTKKYTSGCLSFYEDDLPEEAKNKIMREFEHCLFPGLSQDNYRVLWIEHKDKFNPDTGKNRLELNFLIPNVEILTGQRLQPFYHKADLPRVDLLKKILNFKFSLRDPNDPENQQATTLRKNLPKDIKEFRERLNHYAEQEVQDGRISDRTSMIQWLKELGYEVTKEAKKSLSIKNPYGDEKRPIRLTGLIYEQDFRTGTEGHSLTAKASERYREEARERYQSDLQRYQEQLDRKSRELEGKYRLSERGYTDPSQRIDSPVIANDGGRHQKPESPPNQNNHRASAAAEATSGRPESELAKIQPLEPRNHRSSEAEKSPYFIEYSPSLSSSYFAYQQYLSRLREQKQAERDPGPKREVTADRSDHTAEDPRVSNYHHRPVQSEIKAIGNHHEQDLRSSVVGSYRRATATAEEATARASESLRAYTDTNRHHRGTASVRTNHETASVSHSGSSEGVSAGTATDLARKSLRAIIKDFTSKLGQTVERTFREFGEWFKHREADQSSLGPDLAEASATRNREADQATSRSNTDEIGLSRAVSREIRGFDTAGIFKALDELDRRKVAKKNLDNDYDSPMPF